MTRRALLAAAALSGTVRARTPAYIRPPALRPGDTVGLITPSTYVSDPDRLLLAGRTLRYFGLNPKWGAGVRRREGYLGGSVEERVNDLHALFRDPEVRAVFCIRGGYGSPQLLDHIDYDLLRAHPKILLGYSDITALHLAVHRKAGLVTFHGPVVLSKFTEFTQQSFRKILFETKPAGVLTNPAEPNALRPSHLLRTVRPGKAHGPLIGGNLSLIAATMGTPYEIQTSGCILFLEDVDEQPYSIDRMLTQLSLAGKLRAAAGIIFGECNGCVPRDYKPSFDSTFSLGEVLDRILGKLDVPVLSGLTIGHTDDQLTLPLGVEAVLDADRGALELTEAAVSA